MGPNADRPLAPGPSAQAARRKWGPSAARPPRRSARFRQPPAPARRVFLRPALGPQRQPPAWSSSRRPEPAGVAEKPRGGPRKARATHRPRVRSAVCPSPRPRVRQQLPEVPRPPQRSGRRGGGPTCARSGGRDLRRTRPCGGYAVSPAGPRAPGQSGCSRKSRLTRASVNEGASGLCALRAPYHRLSRLLLRLAPPALSFPAALASRHFLTLQAGCRFNDRYCPVLTKVCGTCGVRGS